MMTHIYLTAEEKVLYEALQGEVKDGWQPEVENLTFEDSPAKRKMRMNLLNLRDPALTVFIESALKIESADMLAAEIQDMTLSEVDESDLQELFFALGPETLSVLIGSLLKDVKTDDDLEGVVALTVLRRSLLESMQPVS